jgi:hypothetical protein
VDSDKAEGPEGLMSGVLMDDAGVPAAELPWVESEGFSDPIEDFPELVADCFAWSSFGVIKLPGLDFAFVPTSLETEMSSDGRVETWE